MTKSLPPLPNGELPAPSRGQPTMGNVSIPSTNGDPLVFLEKVMDNENVDIRYRFDAAKALLPFKYPKLGEEGKKSKKQSEAERVGGGKFATRAANRPVLPH